jgi:guanylate kinase
MKRDILVFVSPASAGKDYLLNKCIEHLGYKKVISHTTRPMRNGEVNNKDYHFISTQEFETMDSNNEFIETTSYKTVDSTWYYGFHKNSIEGDGIKMMILNPEGLNELIEKGYGDRIMIAYVICDTDDRILRYHKRLGDNPTQEQLAEGFLRLIRDFDDFSNFEDEIDGLNLIYRGCPIERIYNTRYSNLSVQLEDIEDFVNYYSKENKEKR